MARAKTADLAGPGIGTYEEVEKILPRNYRALLAPMERMQAVYAVKSYIEENLADEILIDSMCQYTGTTLRTLERTFVRETGVTPQRSRCSSPGSRSHIGVSESGFAESQRIGPTT